MLCNNCGTKGLEKMEKQDHEKQRQDEACERIITLCPNCGYGVISL